MTGNAPADQPVWRPTPERIARAAMTKFCDFVNRRHGLSLADYGRLHAYSVRRPAAFWDDVWDFTGIRAFRKGPALTPAAHPVDVRFFPEARLNYAQNCLKWRNDAPALIFRSETRPTASLSWNALYDAVSRLTQALSAGGVRAGDRICAILPNGPEAIIAFLAASALGAVWSSCSPDFGPTGILNRFRQIAPKLLIACDGYSYNGKIYDVTAKVENCAQALDSVETVVMVNGPNRAGSGSGHGSDKTVTWDAFIAPFSPQEISFVPLAFDHPLYILFSSGTTGAPKCIVHRAGGVLLKQLSEHRLHCDIAAGDRLFYFTTCGWMMWNWLVGGLAAGATLVLFDGSPFFPNEKALFDLAEDTRVTAFGASAKFIDSVKKTGWRPRETHGLESLRTLLSTGSPLAAESYDFIYRSVKTDVHLASISGGTDICGCFVAGVPIDPVWRGEIQGPCLGADIAVFDPDGQALDRGRGELVCRNAIPSMPLGFWNDDDGSKYRQAYFSRFSGVWRQGDFAQMADHGGIIIHGRSDATLNPGGVRIGTGEIYAVVERLDDITEALAIGQSWQGDERIILFVRLREGATLDDALRERIKTAIRNGASPRHVPARVIAVADIPRTKSGKITEMAVRDVVHGRAVKNRDALANPQSLALFAGLAELRE